jgi:hypothetical protein
VTAPQQAVLEVVAPAMQAVSLNMEINYFSSDEEEEDSSDDDNISFITLSSVSIGSKDSSKSGDSEEYDPEIGLDDDSFIVNDM